MFSNERPQNLNLRAALKSIAGTILLILAFGVTAFGQFSSGSTGADGAFNPTVNTTLQVPESGVFNFTTINIPQNIQVTFTKNSRNTPVTILASGNVIVAGRIILDGSNASGRFGGVGGPGGFKGGNGGTPIDSVNGTPGDGPGGGGGGIAGATGAANGGAGGFLLNGTNGSAGGGTGGFGGTRYGTKTLLPLIGGSGGGGGSSFNGGQVIGGGGGGGGGAILIASSGAISFPNNSDTSRGISARGADASFTNTNQVGGGGSGGAIRIVANTISGSPCLDVSDFSIGSTPDGSDGIIRVEAFDLSQYVPRCSTSEQTLGNPNPVTIPDIPTIKIVSVGGVAAPANPVGSNSAVNPDIVVPTSVQNPVQVAIQASNIPVGTVLQVRLTPESGAPTLVNSSALSGTTASSNATANITLPATGISVIRAFVTLDVLVALRSNQAMIDGERIIKVELSASFGGKTEAVYILESGRRVSEFK